jgi:hypothetical protein
MTLRSKWQCKVYPNITKAVNKNHTNTTATRLVGEPALKVIDYTNQKQLDWFDSLPMQLQSRGLRVCMVAIVGGMEPTTHNSETSRQSHMHKEDYDSLVNGKQFHDKVEQGSRALVKPIKLDTDLVSMCEGHQLAEIKTKLFNQTAVITKNYHLGRLATSLNSNYYRKNHPFSIQNQNLTQLQHSGQHKTIQLSQNHFITIVKSRMDKRDIHVNQNP